MSAPNSSSDVKVISLQYLTGVQGAGKVKTVPRLYMKPVQQSEQEHSNCTVSTAPIFLKPVLQTSSTAQPSYSLVTATSQTSYINTVLKNTTKSQLYSQINQTSFNQTNHKTAPSIIYLKPVRTGLNGTSSANKTIQLMPILPQNREGMKMVQTGFCTAANSSAPNEEIVLAELKVPVVKTGYHLPNQTTQSDYLPKTDYQLLNQTMQSVYMPKIGYQLPNQTIPSGYLPIAGYPMPNQAIQSGYLPKTGYHIPNQTAFNHMDSNNGVQFVQHTADILPVKTVLPVASIGNSISSSASPYYVGNKLLSSEVDHEATVHSVQAKLVVPDNNNTSKGKKTKTQKIKEPKKQTCKTVKIPRNSTRKTTSSKNKIGDCKVSPKSSNKKAPELAKRKSRSTKRTISSEHSNPKDLPYDKVLTAETEHASNLKSLEDDLSKSSTKNLESVKDEHSDPLILEGYDWSKLEAAEVDYDFFALDKPFLGLNSVNPLILRDSGSGDTMQIVSVTRTNNKHLESQQACKKIKLSDDYPRSNNRKRDCLIGGDLTNSNQFSGCDVTNTAKGSSLIGQSQAVPEDDNNWEDYTEQDRFYSDEINDEYIYIFDFYDNTSDDLFEGETYHWRIDFFYHHNKKLKIISSLCSEIKVFLSLKIIMLNSLIIMIKKILPTSKQH